MVEYKILLTDEERFNLLADEYFEAVECEDWERVSSLIVLNPNIMAEGLELVYHPNPMLYAQRRSYANYQKICSAVSEICAH